MNGIVRNIALVVSDVICVGASWAVSVYGYRLLGGRYDPEIYLQFWPIVPGYVLLNTLFRLYQGRLFYPAAPVQPVEEMRRLFGSAFILHIGVIAFLALARQTTESYSRVAISGAGLLTMLSSQVLRNLTRTILRRLGIGQIPVVIVGSGPAARRLNDILIRDDYSGFRPIGFFDDAFTRLGELPRMGSFRKVVGKCRKHDVRIMFACVDERIFRCQLPRYTEWFTHIEYFPSAEVFPVSGSQTVSFGGVGGVEMVNQARMKALRFEKWLFDKVLGVLAFLFSLPLLIVIGLLVVLTSPGGPFFRHERLGLGGRKIRIWKFRTMYRDADVRLKRILAEDPAAAAEWSRHYKLRRDPRITPLGRILRKFSLDEIPQIFNVLGGSMALVGPRPIVEDEVKFYGASYDTFASVRPGVTGLWQVSGRSDTDYDRRVALDMHYILNWSPWVDVWICLRTVTSVLTAKGSY